MSKATTYCSKSPFSQQNFAQLVQITEISWANFWQKYHFEQFRGSNNLRGNTAHNTDNFSVAERYKTRRKYTDATREWTVDTHDIQTLYNTVTHNIMNTYKCYNPINRQILTKRLFELTITMTPELFCRIKTNHIVLQTKCE